MYRPFLSPVPCSLPCLCVFCYALGHGSSNDRDSPPAFLHSSHAVSCSSYNVPKRKIRNLYVKKNRTSEERSWQEHMPEVSETRPIIQPNNNPGASKIDALEAPGKLPERSWDTPRGSRKRSRRRSESGTSIPLTPPLVFSRLWRKINPILGPHFFVESVCRCFQDDSSWPSNRKI